VDGVVGHPVAEGVEEGVEAAGAREVGAHSAAGKVAFVAVPGVDDVVIAERTDDRAAQVPAAEDEDAAHEAVSNNQSSSVRM
jgi:hypothetical protein